jgi:hypothetical protein
MPARFWRTFVMKTSGERLFDTSVLLALLTAHALREAVSRPLLGLRLFPSPRLRGEGRGEGRPSGRAAPHLVGRERRPSPGIRGQAQMPTSPRKRGEAIGG